MLRAFKFKLFTLKTEVNKNFKPTRRLLTCCIIAYFWQDTTSAAFHFTYCPRWKKQNTNVNIPFVN